MSIEQTVVQTSPLRVRMTLTLWQTYDVLLVIGLALLLPGLLLVPVIPLRMPVGLALALFAPGYALTLAAFPRYDDLDGVIRAALSFGLSAAVMPVLALVLDKLRWGIHSWPIAIGLATWIVLCCGVALWRRWNLAAGAPQTPMAPRLNWSGGWQTLRRFPRSSTIAAVLVLAGMGILGARVLLQAPAAHLTEFYILGADGLAENYPRVAIGREALSVPMTIVNRERAARTYRVEAWVVEPWNPDRRVLVAQAGPFTLPAGEYHTWPMAWRMTRPGADQQVEFLLFVEGHDQPYRTLRLWVDVIERPALPLRSAGGLP